MGLLGKAIHFGIGIVWGRSTVSCDGRAVWGGLARPWPAGRRHVADPGRGRGAGPRPERPQPGLPGFHPRPGLPRSPRLWGGSGAGGRRAWPLGGAGARVCVTAPANMSSLAMSEWGRGRKRFPAFVGACPICFGDLLQRLWPGTRLSRVVKIFGLPLSALSQNLLNQLVIGCGIMRPCRLRSVPLPKAPRSSPLSLWAAGCRTGGNLAFGCKSVLATLRANKPIGRTAPPRAPRTGSVCCPHRAGPVGADLASLEDGHAPITVRRRLSAIGKMHRFDDCRRTLRASTSTGHRKARCANAAARSRGPRRAPVAPGSARPASGVHSR